MISVVLYFLVYLTCSQVSFSAPLPLVLTRVHTANPTTVTNTYTTGTTTISLPPVEILISDGTRYTFTLSNLPAAAPQQTFITTFQAKQGNPGEISPTENAQATPTPTPTALLTTSSVAQVNQDNAETSSSSIPSATSNVQNNPNPTPDQTQKSTAGNAETTATSNAISEVQNTASATPDQTQTSATGGDETTTTTSTSAGSISPPSTIVYSPYQDSGSCKDYDTISSDLKLISGKGIKKLRIYGTDCNLFSATLPIAKDLGITINQGLWISSSGVDSIDDGLNDLIQYGQKNGWGIFDFITVGNEAVSSGFCSASQLISKIKSVKSKLKSAGYGGKVTTSEPPISFLDNTDLCKKSDIDFVGINPHSYFNTNLYAKDSGDYVAQQKSEVESACGMSVAITETGYPSKGDKNGNNNPSPENQAAAISSIIKATNGDVTILSTFNDFWKDPGTYGIEQYFGTIRLYN